jgi:hypothetical protein
MENKGIVEAQSVTNSQRVSLLQIFQDMFDVKGQLIDDMASSLADETCRVAFIFVDLDNVPNFFEQITPQMILKLQREIFIFCSANRSKPIPCGKFHFSLAEKKKDAADAIICSAATMLHSVLISYYRNADVPFIIVSNDQIFSQVPPYLDKTFGSSHHH